MGKSLDGQVLVALSLMSRNTVDGINYMEFVKSGVMNGALGLIESGYAIKIFKGEDDADYRLTQKGIEYFENIQKYASEQFQVR